MQGDGNVCLPRDQQFPISKTLMDDDYVFYLYHQTRGYIHRRRQTPHVKETTGAINNKAYNNEEVVTFRTGTVSDIEQYV
jgi:hypothetical protein